MLEKKKGQRSNKETEPRNPPIEERRRTGQFSKKNTPQNERTPQFNAIKDETESEPIPPDWRKQRQNKGKFPMTGNPSTRRTEEITK